MTIAPGRTRGIAIALVSSASFAMSGPFAKPLLDAGWSAGGAGLLRIGGSALVLLVPCVVLAWSRSGTVLLRNRGFLLAYGVFAVAGAQIGFFNAIRTLPVGVALLLEYMAPVLVVLWLWLRRGMRPGRLTAAGAVVAMAGLFFVLNPAGGGSLDPVGLAWAVWASLCCTAYFVMSAHVADDLSPVLVVGTGMAVGAVLIGITGALGLIPIVTGSSTVVLGTASLPWWVPALALILVATVFAYLTGILAVRSLGSRLASFVALAEVLFAVLASWALLAQQPSGMQVFGGALVVTGVVLVRRGEPAQTGPVEPVRVTERAQAAAP